MKLLKLTRVLLSLAIADVGWLMVRLAYVLPDGFILNPILIAFGFLLLIGGVLVSLVRLVSLIWEVIAYAPVPIEAPPGTIQFNGKLLLAFIVLNSITHYSLRPHPAIYKSQIIFKDPAIAVQDSMKALRQLCESIEAKDFLSCYVRRRDSTLFFSVPVTRHLESLTPKLGRIDTITVSNKGFRYMNKEDISRLLTLIKFLNRNLIAGIVHDTPIDFWRYPYDTDSYSKGNLYLYLYNTPKDTLSPSFKYYIKDRKEQMVLIGSNNVQD